MGVGTGRELSRGPHTPKAMADDYRSPGLIQRYREELQVRPREMGSAEVNAFLSHLAVNLKVCASTQNQAPVDGGFAAAGEGPGCSTV